MDPSIFQNMMNTQLLTSFSMKDDVGVFQMMWLIVIMNFVKFMPQIQTLLYDCMKKHVFNIQMNEIKHIIREDGTTREERGDIESSITFIKNGKSNDDTVVVNAINNYICNLDNAKFLSFSKNTYSVNNTSDFEINDNIIAKVSKTVSSVTQSDDNEEEYTIQLYSYDIHLEKLKSFVDEIVRKYMLEQNNKLGNQRYFFDEKPVSVPIDTDGYIQFEKAPNDLTFTISPFNTNKSLENVFGTHLNVVKDRVHTFVNNHEWYERKGIPHTLGILLHGKPGTGKTSLIKAIAKDTNRHIFNIHLTKTTTKTQLKNLFFEERITVLNKGRMNHYNIPLDERLYIIEDIDCLTDVVKSRDLDDETSDESKDDNIKERFRNTRISGYEPNLLTTNSLLNSSPISNVMDGDETKPFLNDKSREHPEKLSLSFVLNLLDGILEVPGRIIIMTTNRVNYLDSAFIRPGRIDINLEVGDCDEIMIRDMFEHFYERSVPSSRYPLDYKNKITPAELNKIILDNYDDKDNAWKVLREHVEKDNL
jgi:DNA polymerase III delta prime subunit